MKEYKVVQPKLGFRKWNEKFENILNQHAREGWQVREIMQNYSIVFERDKNR